MNSALRLAWVGGCALLGWYLAVDPHEAWWLALAGGVFGLMTSPEGLARLVLVVVGAIALPMFAFQVVGTHGDYWPFFMFFGGWLGKLIPLKLPPLKWLARRAADVVEKARQS